MTIDEAVTSHQLPSGVAAHQPMGQRATAVVCLLVALSYASPALSQTSSEFWPEIDLYWSATPRYRLFTLARLLYRSPVGQSTAQYGLHLDDMSLLRHGFARVGYRFINTLNDPAHPEHRGILEGTVHGIGATRFVNRVRADLRYMEYDFSARLRERARLEHDIHLPALLLRPYGMAEAFYDSRFGSLARMRYQLGTEVHPITQVGFDLQYVRQDNYRATRTYVNGFVVKLVLTF